MDDPLFRRRKRKLPVLRACGIACFSIFGIAICWLCFRLSQSNAYQPQIPPPPPMPVVNGFDDLVAAGQMLRANGGTKGMYDKNSNPIPNMESVVVARNQLALARLRRGFPNTFQMPAIRRSDDLLPYL